MRTDFYVRLDISIFHPADHKYTTTIADIDETSPSEDEAAYEAALHGSAFADV